MNLQGTLSRRFHWEKVYDEPEPAPFPEDIDDADKIEEDEPKVAVGVPLEIEDVPRPIVKDATKYYQKAVKVDIEKCTKKLNGYRAKHKDTAPMVWSDELAKGAQEWTDHMAAMTLKNKEKTGSEDFKYFKAWTHHAKASQRPGQGENLYWGLPKGDCSAAMAAWYAEIKDYDFATGKSKGGAIGHFTQLLWDTTKTFGVAITEMCGLICQKYGKGMTQKFVIGRFKPPGNYIGQFVKHVHPLA